jgi:hypothetical protein
MARRGGPSLLRRSRGWDVVRPVAAQYRAGGGKLLPYDCCRLTAAGRTPGTRRGYTEVRPYVFGESFLVSPNARFG